jgi:GTP cyclohydrolase I
MAIHNAVNTTISDSKGVAVMIEATHNCVKCRGVKHEGAVMKTSKLTGAFIEESEVRAEFYNFIK